MPKLRALSLSLLGIAGIAAILFATDEILLRLGQPNIFAFRAPRLAADSQQPTADSQKTPPLAAAPEAQNQQNPAAPQLSEEPIALTILAPEDCATCQVPNILNIFRGKLGPNLVVKTVDPRTPAGDELARKNAISDFPGFIFAAEVEQHPSFAMLKEVAIRTENGFSFQTSRAGIPTALTRSLPDPARGFSLGSADAPVTVVEFTDFECPFCGIFDKEKFPAVKEKFIDTGKVRWVMKAAPLDFHAKAKPAHLATICAGLLGGEESFWRAKERVVAEKDSWMAAADPAAAVEALVKEELPTVSPEVFRGCLDGQAAATRLEEEKVNASVSGVNGVPAFFVWRAGEEKLARKMAGVRREDPLGGLSALIEDALKK